MDEILLSLNGTWTLRLDSGEELEARVPGSYELDMMRAAKLANPYYGMNMLNMEKYEYDSFLYTKTFMLDAEPDGSELLIFDGIDTAAEITLNGIALGRSENMLIPYEFAASGLRQGENTLSVHIFSPLLEARKYNYSMSASALKYNYDSLTLRKSPSMYGWDIMPRMLSGGIWRGVRLVRRSTLRLTQAYLFTEWCSSEHAQLTLFWEAELGKVPAFDCGLKLTLSRGGKEFDREERIWGKCGRLGISVENPELWYPKNCGEQPLYDVRVDLIYNGEVQDRREFRTGIRTVRLDRTDALDEQGRGRFCFEVNGKKVFVLGTNHVPPDAIPARADRRVRAILDLIDDIGCNFIRIWGGSHYETDEFYDLCDERGLLVWQDFVMACGNYPQTEEFAGRLRSEAVAVVRRLRQHPSLVLWAGDNECDQSYGGMGQHRDPNGNSLTRHVLPQVIRDEDYTRPYLPSSPYMSPECFAHGGWGYAVEDHLWGDRKYYKSDFYRNARPLFASEMGYHGCPSPESIREFISPDSIWPYTHNREWLLHASSTVPQESEPYGYRIELMANQIKVLFGEVPDNIDDFSLASQISQAEAKKYFVERFRIKKPERTGIIWWNIIDGWPQFSDAVVDWYFRKKLAYEYIKRSQSRLCIMADEPENGIIKLVAVNDHLEEHSVEGRVISLEDGREIASFSGCAGIESAQELASFQEPDSQELLLIEWESADEKGRNTFLTGKPPYDLTKYKSWLEKLK